MGQPDQDEYFHLSDNEYKRYWIQQIDLFVHEQSIFKFSEMSHQTQNSLARAR